jgi:hypothetical protein
VIASGSVEKAGPWMGDKRNDRERAYAVAKTHERAFTERYFPVPALGSHQPEQVTPEILAEFEQLRGATEAARVA